MKTYIKDFNLKLFYIKRIRSIYPMYYSAYIIIFIAKIILYGFSFSAPIWTLILTFLGIDGWSAELIPNYALVGDWFIGCIIIIYIFFPLLRYLIKHANITIIMYSILFLLYEHFYPWNFNERNSIILRTFEVLIGIFYLQIGSQKQIYCWDCYDSNSSFDFYSN